MNLFFKHIILLCFLLLNNIPYWSSYFESNVKEIDFEFISSTKHLKNSPIQSFHVHHTISESSSKDNFLVLLEIFGEEEKEEKEEKDSKEHSKKFFSFFKISNKLELASLLSIGIINDSKKFTPYYSSLKRCSINQVFII